MAIQVKTDQGDIFNVDSIRFSGGERHIQIPLTIKPPVASVNIFARINNADELLVLLLLENALRHRFGRALAIDVEMPYLPYSRQDRVCAEGQAFSLEVVATLIKSMNIRTLVTWDCHSDVGISLTGASNVSSENIIQTCPPLMAKLTAANAVLICPDKGAKTRCEVIQATLDIPELVYCEKRRDPATGKIQQTDVLAQSLTGKIALITDDICDGGYTFINIAQQLKAKNAKKIILYVTHGIFSKGIAAFDGLIDEIYTTTSFKHKPHNKLIEIPFRYQGEYA